MKNNCIARSARAYFIFWHFADVLVLSTTSYDLFSSCVDDGTIWLQTLNFDFLSLKCWFQFNSGIAESSRNLAFRPEFQISSLDLNQDGGQTINM